MTTLDALLAAFCLTAAFLHLLSTALAVRRCRRQRERLPAPRGSPAVTVLRPVCGIDNFGETTLRSSFELDYPDYELVFCCADATDPAAGLVRGLMARYPGVRAKLLIGRDAISPNPKLNNLVKGWAHARRDWLIFADSNVLMPPDYIQRLLASWEADTGVLCSPPIGSLPAGIWSEVECAFLNTYQARWQYAADSVGFGFAQGKTMLWRRRDLAARRAGSARWPARSPRTRRQPKWCGSSVCERASSMRLLPSLSDAGPRGRSGTGSRDGPACGGSRFPLCLPRSS